MLLLTHALGGGNGSAAACVAAFGSSFASADFSLRTRGLSGKRSAAIVSRSNLMTAAGSSGVRFSSGMGLVWRHATAIASRLALRPSALPSPRTYS
jgi:hypothetical protein